MAVLAVLALPATANASWRQPASGVSPINQAANPDAVEPSLAEIGDIPHIAWSESDGTDREVRVGRPNAAGTAWEQPVGGASPINSSRDQPAVEPSLAEIGGVPYVAWTEFDGTNTEVRVSRLNAAGTAWEQPVGGASPINHANRVPLAGGCRWEQQAVLGADRQEEALAGFLPRDARRDRRCGNASRARRVVLKVVSR